MNVMEKYLHKKKLHGTARLVDFRHVIVSTPAVLFPGKPAVRPVILVIQLKFSEKHYFSIKSFFQNIVSSHEIKQNLKRSNFIYSSRVQAVGLLVAISRIGAAFSPFIMTGLKYVHESLPFAILGILNLFIGLFCLHLRETNNAPSPDTVDDCLMLMNKQHDAKHPN